jgi:hypothetical protein
MALAAFGVFYWTCVWAIAGLVLASFVAGLLLLPVLFWPGAFTTLMPWYTNGLPVWLVGGGFVSGGVVCFVHNVRIVLGEVRRTLFFAEVKELAEQIVDENSEEPIASDHGFSATPCGPRRIENIQLAEDGLFERPA